MARSSWDEAPITEMTTTAHYNHQVNSGEAVENDRSKSPSIVTSDREELIQCIKRGEKPVWVPKYPPTDSDGARLETVTRQEEVLVDIMEQKILQPHNTGLDLIHHLTAQPDPINRPPSALHAGDFRQQSGPSTPHQRSIQETHGSHSYSTSPPPWHLDISPSLRRNTSGSNNRSGAASCTASSRAPSLGSSLSSSFVLRAPTSPLSHASNNASLDIAPLFESDFSAANPGRANRRRTLPPGAFNAWHRSVSEKQPTEFSKLPLTLRRDSSLPQQSHTSRRSLNSFTYQPMSNPQVHPSLRSRRTSFGSDTSSRQHAAMVGSFEESILRGRMSTAPSKPLDFVAQIGVLGKGNCKPSLKCPAHVSVPFPAVFYNYPSTNARRSLADDSPSPYVGSIDLRHNLPLSQPAAARKRNHRPKKGLEQLLAEVTGAENTTIGTAPTKEAYGKKQSPSGLLLSGCYRVPEQGQLQIVIKNPNKTAVKLFLVPYDLEGMEPGHKTFVRQRSFSAGPILEEALDVHQAAAQKTDPVTEKQVLRYLIHLKFCCPVRGRHYLYDNIRVVFANRVPDGKENLRNEVQLPEPRYSPWKPAQELPPVGGGFHMPRENFARRRSSGFGVSSDIRETLEGFSLGYGGTVDVVPPLPTIPNYEMPTANQHGRYDLDENSPPDAGPEQASPTRQSNAQPHSSNCHETQQPASDQSITSGGAPPHVYTRRSPVPWLKGSDGSNERCYSPPPPMFGDGLLSRQLREYSGRSSANNHENQNP